MMAKYDNAMVAHVWAQQTKESGESNNGNMWFAGRTIYSYGVHFPLATILPDGAAFVNSDSSSRTTNGKHKPAVRRALGYDRPRTFYVPDLRALMSSLDSVDGSGLVDKAHGGSRARLVEYLEAQWAALSDDAGAYLLRASGSRAAWSNWKAERARKAETLAKRNASRAKRAALALARETAAVPVDMVRLRMIEQATRGNDYGRESRLNSSVSVYVDAWRDAPTGTKLKAALWERVKLARELRARLLRNSPERFNRTRGAIVTLRRIWAGDYGAQQTGTPTAELNAALSEIRAIREALEAHGPRQLRERAGERLEALAAVVERLEREREAARMAEQQAEREAWLSNAPDAPRRAYHLADERGGALIRALGAEVEGCRVVAGTLETSQGATVPLRHAARVFAFVRGVRDSGKAWSAAEAGRTIHVGHFRVDRVEPSGDFVAGCHRINWNETERLSRELGLWDCPATALASDDDGEA